MDGMKHYAYQDGLPILSKRGETLFLSNMSWNNCLPFQYYLYMRKIVGVGPSQPLNPKWHPHILVEMGLNELFPEAIELQRDDGICLRPASIVGFEATKSKNAPQRNLKVINQGYYQ